MMKKIVLMLAISGVLTLSGCALFDHVMLDQVKDEQGHALYWDPNHNYTTNQIDPVTKKPNQPVYSNAPSPLQITIQNLLASILGPWGATATAGTGLLFSLYKVIRGRMALNKANALAAAEGKGKELLSGILADITSGKLDTDKDGKVSMEEIKAYVAAKANDAIKPEFVQEILETMGGTIIDKPEVK